MRYSSRFVCKALSFTLALLVHLTSISVLCGTAHSQIKKSLVYIVDGMGYGESGFDYADKPNIDSLIDGSWANGYHGAYADRAFAGGVKGTPTQQRTVTGPGWSSILTGVWYDRHGVYDNGVVHGRILTLLEGDWENNPTYMGTLKNALPTLKTASYVPFPDISRELIGSVDSDDDPTNDMDKRFEGTSVVNIEKAVQDLSGLGSIDPDVLFVGTAHPDNAGHYSGWPSREYTESIEVTDGLLGMMLDAISNRPTFAQEDWQIILTTDHGMNVRGHGEQTEQEKRIPLIISSKNLSPGVFPVDDGVSHADVPPTVLDHFGVTLPSHYWGSSRAAGITEMTADFDANSYIDGSDLSEWITNYSSGSGADTDNDNDSDGTDFLNWQRQFGNGTPPSSASQSVPEPTTLLLACGFTLLPLLRREST